jgi:hypothetical protein
MTDGALREPVHRVELRIERLDARFDGLEKRMATMEGRVESLDRTITTRFEGLEAPLNTKASNWVVSLWGTTLAALIALLTLRHGAGYF